jgi:hypothetical protein
MRRPWARRLLVTVAVLVVVAGAAFGGLSWRLARGPISLDLATPWLVEAIQEKLGSQQRVEVGGTQIERGADGRTSVRLLDVRLRDGAGAVLASAPKVEVGLSGTGLMTGQIRAERISLVDAEVSVRIDAEGRLTVAAGGETRPVATGLPPSDQAIVATPSVSSAKPEAADGGSLYRSGVDGFTAMLAWIERLSRTGLNGYEFSEIGLKSGTLVVEDQREGMRWTFDNIDISMIRQRGGVHFNVRSDSSDRRWSISASATRGWGDRRIIELEAVRVPAKDLLLALRFADLPFKADLPLSVRLRTEIGPTGVPEILQGTIIAESGFVGGDNGSPGTRVEHIAANFDWNAARRALLVPLQVALGSHRFTLVGRIDVPVNPADPWQVHLGGGSIVLGADTRAPVVFNRIQVNAQIDAENRRLRVENAEFGNAATGLAMSGGLDFAGTPRLMLGLAARRMSLPTMLKLWPAAAAPDVRSWVMERVVRASVDQVDVAINAPLEVLASSSDQPIPDDGLSVAVTLSGAAFRPVESLPAIHDADVEIRATGRTATVKLGHGAITMPSGRTMIVSDGLFRVPDTNPEPVMSHTSLRMRGPVAAAAELLATERLRAASGAPLDPATSRGDFDARVTLDIPLLKDLTNAAVAYAVDAEFTNFAADRMIMDQRVEAASLQLNADNSGYRVKGEVKVAGAPVTIEYRKPRGSADDEIRVQGVLDDAARARLGFDLAPALSGPVPVKIAGRTGANGKDGRITVEADLTQARIDDILPGLAKPPARSARATFTLVSRPTMTRIEDLVFDGSGAAVRGSIVIDASGKVASANFPVFSLSSGDKASLRAERTPSGGFQATLRGDVFDGRPFIESLLAGRSAKNSEDSAKNGEDKEKPRDIDLDARIGAIAGHHGEALRGLELKLSRRDGNIRSFSLRARLGRNATVTGDLRRRQGGGQALHLETSDAGALFRFTDVYSRIVGGRMIVAMDPPAHDQSPQHGTLSIDNFSIRGEAALERVVSGAEGGRQPGVDFSSMRVDFTRMPGLMTIRDGVVRGPLIGGTIDGTIDYRREDVHMRGTLVPLYGLNNMFGQLPIVGLFLGGGRNEGLVGLTYEVVGTPSSPVLRVNPISAVAPGFIRKFFEFPEALGSTRPPGSIQSTR